MQLITAANLLFFCSPLKSASSLLLLFLFFSFCEFLRWRMETLSRRKLKKTCRVWQPKHMAGNISDKRRGEEKGRERRGGGFFWRAHHAAWLHLPTHTYPAPKHSCLRHPAFLCPPSTTRSASSSFLTWIACLRFCPMENSECLSLSLFLVKPSSPVLIQSFLLFVSTIPLSLVVTL